MRDLLRALALAWIVTSVVTIAALVTPIVLSAEQIARITPRCERKTKLGTECFFCGMTRGFIAIAHGRFRDAELSNKGAVPLYAGFLCNGLCLGFVLARPHRLRALNDSEC